jgi:hypothetical protein
MALYCGFCEHRVGETHKHKDYCLCCRNNHKTGESGMWGALLLLLFILFLSRMFL